MCFSGVREVNTGTKNPVTWQRVEPYIAAAADADAVCCFPPSSSEQAREGILRPAIRSANVGGGDRVSPPPSPPLPVLRAAKYFADMRNSKRAFAYIKNMTAAVGKVGLGILSAPQRTVQTPQERNSITGAMMARRKTEEESPKES